MIQWISSYWDIIGPIILCVLGIAGSWWGGYDHDRASAWYGRVTTAGWTITILLVLTTVADAYIGRHSSDVDASRITDLRNQLERMSCLGRNRDKALSDLTVACNSVLTSLDDELVQEADRVWKRANGEEVLEVDDFGVKWLETFLLRLSDMKKKVAPCGEIADQYRTALGARMGIQSTIDAVATKVASRLAIEKMGPPDDDVAEYYKTAFSLDVIRGIKQLIDELRRRVDSARQEVESMEFPECESTT